MTRQPGRRRPRDPHRVVHRQLGRGQGARVVRGGGQPRGPLCDLGDLGAGQPVRPVPQGAGQGREHPGPQGQRAAVRFQPPRGLAEQVEQLGVLRSRPVPERLDAECRPRQPDRVPGGPAGVGGLAEPLRGQVRAPGALVRRGELEQDLGALPGAGRAAFGDDVQRPQVVPAGVLVAEARGGFPGREQRVLQRVRPRLRARGQQVHGDPRGRTRSRLQRAADGQVDRGPGGDAQAIDDGLAIQVVSEPRRGGARDDAGLTGLVEQAQHRGLTAGRGAVRQQAGVDVAARDGRPFQQPDALGGEPGQPAPQRLRDAGRDLGRLLPRALREKQPDQLPDEERVAAAARP